MDSQMQELGRQAEQALSYAAWAGPIGLVVLGIVLWLGGRRMARALGATAGLLVGAGMAYLLARDRSETALMVAGTIGALLGAVLAWALFRIWMGAALAALLTVALPIGGLALQAVSPPRWAPRGATEHESAAPLLEELGKATAAQGDDDGVGGQTTSDRLAAVLGDHVRDVTTSWWDRQRVEVDAWWQEMEAAQRASAMALAGLGAVLGVLVGLIWPYTSAALQSSLIGAVLAWAGLSRLTLRNGEAVMTGFLPDTPAQMVSVLGLITLVGVLLQWTLWRRRADK